jgi:hypothetical protein
MKNQTKQPQTATGFLAAILIGLIVGAVPFWAISSTGDRIVALSVHELRSAQALDRWATRLRQNSKLGIPPSSTDLEEMIRITK